MILPSGVLSKGRRCLILGTASSLDEMERLDDLQSMSGMMYTGALMQEEIGCMVDGRADSVNSLQQADGNFATFNSTGASFVPFFSERERQTDVCMRVRGCRYQEMANDLEYSAYRKHRWGLCEEESA